MTSPVMITFGADTITTSVKHVNWDMASAISPPINRPPLRKTKTRKLVDIDSNIQSSLLIIPPTTTTTTTTTINKSQLSPRCDICKRIDIYFHICHNTITNETTPMMCIRCYIEFDKREYANKNETFWTREFIRVRDNFKYDDLNYQMISAFYINDLTKMHECIKLGAYDFNWLLAVAAEDGDREIVDLCLEHNANEFRRACTYALYGNEKEIFEYLKSCAIKTNIDAETWKFNPSLKMRKNKSKKWRSSLTDNQEFEFEAYLSLRSIETEEYKKIF